MRGIASTPGKGPDQTPAAKPVTAPRVPQAPASGSGELPAQSTGTEAPPRNQPRRSISRRITAMTILVSFAGLLCAGIVFFACDIYAHYVHARDSVATLGRVAAENVRTPLHLGYVQTASATLEAITAEPNITGAAVYRANGETFARSTREGSTLPVKVAGDISGAAREFPYIRHFVPIVQKGQRLGTVVVEATLAPLYSRLGVYSGIVCITVGLAWIATWLLTGRLVPAISRPIAELANVAEQVAKGRDYSIRATKRGNDETGDLVDAFNRMLQEIERRDDEILRARADLEINVLARTSELHQQIEDRKQVQTALTDSEHRYRNLFENNPMPMFVVDLETLNFIAVNIAAMRHYGYSEAQFLRLSLPSITKADPLDVARTLRSGARSMDAGEWIHRQCGGKTIEVHLTAHAIVLGGRVAKIILSQDVTERNRTQREVDELNKKLLETSRQAGMAEIATGVLHNVGNVLNSVNVSASVLAESVKETKAAGIRRVAEMLQANADDLPALFSEKGKAHKLPQYLAALATQLEQEQVSKLAELELLVKNVEHIKEIVVAQQDYAKVTGLLATHQPKALVEGALKMAEFEFASERIDLHIEMKPGTPLVRVDRHKVLQILLNLLANARHAMSATPEGERRIDIFIDSDATKVRIAMADRGCGIPLENLTRIFNHGFTTKKNGHGFGLHASANAAREMGGALTATNNAHGATFTLELPIAPQGPKPPTAPKTPLST